MIDISENFENGTLSPCFHFLCYLLRCKMLLLFNDSLALYFRVGVFPFVHTECFHLETRISFLTFFSFNMMNSCFETPWMNVRSSPLVQVLLCQISIMAEFKGHVNHILLVVDKPQDFGLTWPQEWRATDFSTPLSFGGLLFLKISIRFYGLPQTFVLIYVIEVVDITDYPLSVDDYRSSVNEVGPPY